MMKRLLAIFVIATVAFSVSAQEFKFKWSADKGDGTFINPIVNADFPDCDVIRVNDTFYFVSTTMYHFPGCTLLKSKDLVNWEYCANPLKQILDNDAYNLLNGKHHYSQGMWASTLNYHDGKFYIYFPCSTWSSDAQHIVLTAEDPEGEWEVTRLSEGYHDPGWLFDDGPNGDGYLYVACGIGDIWVNKLNPKTFAKISSSVVASVGNGCEGSHMYHIGDYYYIYATYGGTEGSQTIFRSKNPMGPYEEHNGRVFANQKIHQGALVDTQTGEWWTVLFKDAGAIGRIPFLEPVVWEDGWPIIGNNGRDVSEGGKKYPKPNVGATYEKTYLPTNDAFNSYTLGMQWEWNHNPQPDAWSLSERPGWLRLHSCTVTDNLVYARGSLSQRIFGFSAVGTSSDSYAPSYGTAAFDLSGMQDGDIAGLAVVQNPYSFIGVKMVNGKKYLYSCRYKFDGRVPTLQEEKTGAELTSDQIYLRAQVNFGKNTCSYLYSYQPKTGYKSFGVSMSMGYTLDFFVGQRFYLFNYSTKATGGHIDVDWFTTELSVPEDYFKSLDEAQEAYVNPDESVFTGFPFTEPEFSSIIGNNTVNLKQKKIRTSKDGIVGWRYRQGWDLSAFNYLCVKLSRKTTCNLQVKIYDGTTIWSEPYIRTFTSNEKDVAIDLQNLITASGRKIDPLHIYIIAFGSDGSADAYLKEVFLSDDGSSPSAINDVEAENVNGAIYNLAGQRVLHPSKGIYIQNGNKILMK